MKLGTGADPVNAIELRMALSRAMPADPKREQVKFLRFQDGSVRPLDFGARQQVVASVSVELLSKSDFIILVDYLSAHEGDRVALQENQENERVFGPNYPPGTETQPSTAPYYVRILEHGQYSEADFSPSRGLFGVNMRLAYAGAAADGSDEGPATDSALIDALVRMDTTGADYIQATTPAGTAEGLRWLKTTDKGLYLRTGGAWVLQFTTPTDDPAVGLKNGTFYWSAFAPAAQNIPAGIAEAHVAGWINYGSIDFGDENIDLNDGPAIARKEGFAFSVCNAARFHKYLADNNVNLSGAKAYLSILRDTGGARVVTQIRSGRVNSAQFSMTDYKVACEPEALNISGRFPSQTIETSSARYADVMASAIGKPVIRTYGEFGMAALQNVSSDRTLMDVPRANDSTAKNVTAAIDRTYTDGDGKHTRLLVNKTGTASYQYLFTAEQVAGLNDGQWCAQVFADTTSGSDNPAELRRVVSVNDVDVAGWWALYIDLEFPTLPASNAGPAPGTDYRIEMGLARMAYKFQTGEAASGGFGTVLEDGTWSGQIKLWTLDENQKALVEVPACDFTQNADGNLVTLAPKVGADSSKVTTFAELFGENWRPLAEKFDHLPGNHLTRQTVDFDVDDFPLDTWFELAAQWREVWVFTQDPYKYCLHAFTARRNYTPNPWEIWNQAAKYPITTTDFDGGARMQCAARIPKMSASYPPPATLNNSLILAWQYPVNHSMDYLLLDVDDLRLAVSFDIASWWERMGDPYLSGSPAVWVQPGKQNTRWSPTGFILRMRLRKSGGSYIENADWKKEIDAAEIGCGAAGNPFRIKIDNMPGAEDGGDSGFTARPPALENIFPAVVLSGVVQSVSDLGYLASFRTNDRAWVRDKGLVYVCTNSGSSWVWAVDGAQPALNDFLWEHKWTPYTPSTLLDNRWKVAQDPAVIPGGKKLVAAVAFTDYTPAQVLKGRDLFDLSSVVAPSNIWADIEAVEFALAPQNLEDGEWWGTNDDTEPQFYHLDMTALAPRLFSTSEISVKDRPMFSDARGATLGSGWPTSAEDVTAAVLDECYPGAISNAALMQFFDLPTRAGWAFRKQFVEQKSAEETLSELLRNLWAVAVITDEDLLAIKSLNPSDYGTVAATLTDSSIILDTIEQVEQRTLEKIFQRFEMAYDYNPPGGFSAALRKWNRVQVTTPTSGTTEEKTALGRSATIWNRAAQNVQRMEFEYHYGTAALPLNTWAVKWFAFNAWVVKFQVQLDDALGAGGLRLMDLVNVNSYFLTGGQNCGAFVVGRRPNLYEGTCELTLFIWAPPGYLGGFTDNYNDALNMETRDTALWNDGNGKVNSAGQIETRSTPAEKDAAQVETRIF